MIRNFKNKTIHRTCESIARWQDIFSKTEPNTAQNTIALKTVVYHRIELIQELEEQEKKYND